MAKIINTSQFRGSVEENQGVVVVDFFATWCGPCKMLAPVLEEVASDRDELKVVKMDIDENMELAKTYGVMSVPTLMLFKDGNMISKKIGFMPKELITSWVEENK